MGNILKTICAFCCGFTVCVQANQINGSSATMMRHLKAEINEWEFLDGYCELSALRGIERLLNLNLSHPVKEGLSLVYFVPKSNTTAFYLFGSKKVRWSFNCCIGFKDLYFGKDFLIDMAYRCMTGDDKRIIEKEEYMDNIPNDVTIFIIPCMILEKFIESKQVTIPQLDLEEFFKSHLVNRSIICTKVQWFRLPTGCTDLT